MRRVAEFLGVSMLMASAMAGCGPGRRDEGWPEPRPLGREFPTIRPPASPEEAPEKPPLLREPGEQLTLREAVALALLRNPELASFAWEVRAREARILQASLYPNPGLGLAVENLGGKASVTGGLQSTLQLSQLIELGGKRSGRMEVASLERDLAGWDYEVRRIEILTRVSGVFIDALGAQRRLALTEDLVRLAEQSATAVSERVKGGKAPPVEETKANVTLAVARIAMERMKRELEGTRKALSSLWGEPNPRFKALAGELETVQAVPKIEELAALLNQNPELALWAAEIARRQAVVELEKSRAIPDVTVSGGYRRIRGSDESDNTFVAGLSISLPLFDRNQGAIREARFQTLKAADERRAAEIRIGLLLSDAYRALSSAYEEAVALRDAVLPGAQSAFETVSEGYRLGRFGLLEVLDSQRTLADTRAQYLRALTDYHKAVLDVERLIGDRLDAAKKK